MVFNATFNNISFISWCSVLLVDETGVPGENHRPVTSHWQTWSHNVVSSTPCHERDLNVSDDRHWTRWPDLRCTTSIRMMINMTRAFCVRLWFIESQYTGIYHFNFQYHILYFSNLLKNKIKASYLRNN
jgi:hypothetical protein